MKLPFNAKPLKPKHPYCRNCQGSRFLLPVTSVGQDVELSDYKIQFTDVQSVHSVNSENNLQVFILKLAPGASLKCV